MLSIHWLVAVKKKELEDEEKKKKKKKRPAIEMEVHESANQV